MGHKADKESIGACICSWRETDLVILSNIDLGSSMNVGSVTLLRSAPGLSWEMMCDNTVLKTRHQIGKTVFPEGRQGTNHFLVLAQQLQDS